MEMNIIHDVNDIQAVLPGLIAPALQTALAHFPVVLLTGARQTGVRALARGGSLPQLGQQRDLREWGTIWVLWQLEHG